MATPRQSKEQPSAPSGLQVSGGGTSPDRGYEIFERLGGIERSITYLEARSTDTDRKLEALAASIGALSKEVADAKAAFGVIQPLLKGIGKALWAIVAGIVVFLLSVGGMWLKHHFGW